MADTLPQLKAQEFELRKQYNRLVSQNTSGGKTAESYAAEARVGEELGSIRTKIDVLENPEKYSNIANTNAANNSATGQTAQDSAANATTPIYDGQGNIVNGPTAIDPKVGTQLSPEELAKLRSNLDTDPTASAARTSAAIGSANKVTDEASTTDQAAAKNAKTTVGATGISSSNTETSASAKKVPGANSVNKLHQFSGYTYKITLYLLTVEDYTALSQNPDNFSPKHVLISSGGGIPADASKTSSWHPDFQEDFYFDNLSMTTVVGLNSRSKASNAIEFKFSIIEPYGMSLLDRLLSACTVTCSNTNYLDQPYMMQVDFLSNPSEANTNGISNHLIDRKRMAIKFIEFKIKPSANGTTYNISAIPYHHVAFTESAGTVPANLSVEAATIADYFGVDPATGKGTDYNLEKSFTTGYNNHYNKIANKEGRTTAPLYQIEFDIDPIIAKSKIVDEKTESRTTVLNDQKSSANATTAEGTNKDFKVKSVFSNFGSTSLINLIDRVIASSEYVKTQIENAKKTQEQQNQASTTTTGTDGRTTTNGNNTTADASSYSTTKWYKIIPSVIVGPYDKASQSFTKKIIYSIRPYETGNFYHPDFKQTKVKSTQCVRTYYYYYTGLNQDIVQFDIDFDATFVTAITTFSKFVDRSRTPDGSQDTIESKEETPELSPSTFPMRTVMVPVDTQYYGQNNRNSAEDAKVSSVMRSLYSGYPRGDMLNVKLKIVGDPSFVKQDDVLYQPTATEAFNKNTNKGNSEPPITSQGQVIFDKEQVYVQLIIGGVTDIDDTTGITNKVVQLSNGQVAGGSFSGIYKVLTVTSEWSRGKFEQVLNLVRVPDTLAVKTNPPGVATTSPNKLNNVAEQATTDNPGVTPSPTGGGFISGGYGSVGIGGFTAPTTDTALAAVGNSSVSGIINSGNFTI